MGDRLFLAVDDIGCNAGTVAYAFVAVSIVAVVAVVAGVIRGDRRWILRCVALSNLFEILSMPLDAYNALCFLLGFVGSPVTCLCFSFT